jgi:hypothetical protein
MSLRNGPRGAVTFWSWAVVVVAAVLFAGWVYTVFVGSIFL